MAAGDSEPAKRLLPYLQRADELQKHDPKVSYYCRLYAMEMGLKIPKQERTKTTNDILVALMKQLEKDKKSVTIGPEDQFHVEGFALNVFAKADKQDRAGRADLNVAKTFYAAAIFFEILSQFGDLQPEIEQKQKYAAWKAADIRKAIKEGRKPEPGPPGGDQDYIGPSTTPAITGDSRHDDAFVNQPRQDTSATTDTYKLSSPLPPSHSLSASYPPAEHLPSMDMHQTVSGTPKEPPPHSAFTSDTNPTSSIDTRNTVHPNDYKPPPHSQPPFPSSPAIDQSSVVSPAYPQTYSQSYTPQEHHEYTHLAPQPPYASHDMPDSYSFQPPQEHHQPLPAPQRHPSDDMVNPFAYQPPQPLHQASQAPQTHLHSPGRTDSYSYPALPQEQHHESSPQQHHFSLGMVNSSPLYGHQPYSNLTDNNPPSASAPPPPPASYNQHVSSVGHVGAPFVQRPDPHGQGIPPSNGYDPTCRNETRMEKPQASAAFAYDCNYLPPPEKIADAQKAARFAVGALAFDEIPVAVDFLRQALELLTNPSAKTQ